jgi:hypothetical protein
LLSSVKAHLEFLNQLDIKKCQLSNTCEYHCVNEELHFIRILAELTKFGCSAKAALLTPPRRTAPAC